MRRTAEGAVERRAAEQVTDPTQGSCFGGDPPGTRPFAGQPVHDNSRADASAPAPPTRRSRVARATIQSPTFIAGVVLTAVGTFLTIRGYADLGGVLIAIGSALSGGNAVHRMHKGGR